MSLIKVNSIVHPTGTANNITLDNAGNVTVGGGLSMGTPFTFRNRIINGAMTVDQRNSGASQTITAAAALAYTVDRWYAYCTGANVTGQRVAGDVANTFRYRFTGASSVTAIGFGQRIEALNCADLAGTTATLAVDISNSILTTVTWTAFYANTADTFGTLASPTRTQIATGTFTVTSTVTRYSTQISIPAAATTGIEIVFTVGAQTSGTWVIGNVQLEAGSMATPFERRPFGFELSLCQRYMYRLHSALTNHFLSAGTWSGATAGFFQGQMPQLMRAVPTLTLEAAASGYSIYTVSSSSYIALTALTLNGVTSQNFYLFNFTTASGGTTGHGGYLTSNSGAWGAQLVAEL